MRSGLSFSALERWHTTGLRRPPWPAAPATPPVTMPYSVTTSATNSHDVPTPFGDDPAYAPTEQGGLPSESPQADESTISIGHVGRYALKRRLGEGGMGTVHAAHDPVLHRMVALKTLNLSLPAKDREGFHQMFLTEARAGAGLNHPHIVTVYDAGVAESGPYIAMELLKGRDMRQLLKEGWRPTAQQAALIVHRIADALGYAHTKGLVHRDIKPANLFMTGRTNPMVLDFGVARIADKIDSLSDAGMLVGSPHYMAPEQLQHGVIDHRVDVYSLGVVLYELLTGKRPFTGGTVDELCDAVIHEDPVPPHIASPGVPPALSAMVMRALQKRPDDRYRSARSFGRDLKRWLTTNAPDEEPASWSRWFEVMKANPALAVSSFAGVLVLAIGGGLAWTARTPAGLDVVARAAMAPPAAQAMPEAARVEPPTAAIVPKTPPRAAKVAGHAAATVASGAVPAQASAPISALVTPSLPGPGPAAGTVVADAPVAAATAADAGGAAIESRIAQNDAAAERAPLVDRAASPPVSDTPSRTPDAKADPKSDKQTRADKLKAEKALAEKQQAERRKLAVAKAAASASPAPVVHGIVQIAVSPWGQVEVDGKPAGVAPPLNSLSLPEGTHTITLRNDEFPPHTVTVTVSGQQPVAVRHKF